MGSGGLQLRGEMDFSFFFLGTILRGSLSYTMYIGMACTIRYNALSGSRSGMQLRFHMVTQESTGGTLTVYADICMRVLL